MQIDHITFSKTGGAGIVAQTIAASQRELGHDVNVLTVVDSDLRSEPLTRPLLTVAAALDEWVLSSREEKTLFSPLRGNLESLDPSKIRPDSIIHLHWMSGVMNHQTLEDLLVSGRKVVWTLHDMNPFTGGCHHSHACQQFTQNCSGCPQARTPFRSIVSANLQRKALATTFPNLRVVAPTSWMLNQAGKSTVFQNQKSLVISNPIDDSFFEEPSRLAAREKLGISSDTFVGAVVAKDLSDPNKNLGLVLRAFEEVSQRVNRRFALLLIGNNGAPYSSKLVDIIWISETTIKEIAGILTATDIVLSGSIAESAGMTILEGAALGVPSIALTNGGTSSLIEHEKTGMLCRDFEAVTSSITELAGDSKKLSELGGSAKKSAESHRPEVIARTYLELYSSIG